MKYTFIQSQRRHHSLSRLCRVLNVSRSGFDAWQRRGPKRSDEALLKHIMQVHKHHRGHCGALKTWRVLNAQGVRCGKHRVARIRREHGIVAKRRRRFVVTTKSQHTRWHAPNVLQRNFTAHRANQVWVGDVTFIATRRGFLFLAVLLDLYSRRVVGWSMSSRNDTELVLSALQMAVAQRRPKAGLIHHTDQGQTYLGTAYRRYLIDHQIRMSMSRRANCWDNAVAESFFATLKLELVEGRVFANHEVAKTAIFEFIEVFYNRQRSHATLNYQTPAQYEGDTTVTLNPVRNSGTI